MSNTTMNKIQASAFILTKNEERNIARALSSICDFDDVVVVDSGSTDDTILIAQQFTDRVSIHEWEGWARQSDLAASLCRYDWILKLDADEEATPELIAEIRSAIDNTNLSGLKIPFEERFLGLPNSRWTQKIAKVRFWRKSRGTFGDEYVHEGLTLSGQIQSTRGCIVHYGESSVSVKVLKNDTYSNLKAMERFDRGRKFCLVKLLLTFPVAFFRSYLLRRSCCDGTRGFIQSFINAFYAFLKEAKLYELELNKKRSKL